MTDWWVGIAAAEQSIPCGGEHHRLRWEQGRLVACDHGDPDDELVLAALGGQELHCIELVRAWERHRDDLRVLVIGPRGSSDVLRPEADPPPAGRRAIGRSRVRARSGPTGHRRVSATEHPEGRLAADELAELITLCALGGGLGERFVATVAAEWAARLRDGHPGLDGARTRLRAALYGRLCPAIRSWLGDPELSLELEMTAAEHPRSLARVDDIVHAQLPFTWLPEVWARDLTTVQGRFCLDAQPGSTDGGHLELATVAPDLHTRELVELRIRSAPGP